MIIPVGSDFSLSVPNLIVISGYLRKWPADVPWVHINRRMHLARQSIIFGSKHKALVLQSLICLFTAHA
jgi:hypothetical protein